MVSTAESTQSSAYTDLATPGPSTTVTVGASGKVIVTLTSRLWNTTNNGVCHMSFAIDLGAASDLTSLEYASSAIAAALRGGVTYFISGLTPGSHTFTAKYRRQTAATGCSFSDRHITVTPIQ